MEEQKYCKLGEGGKFKEDNGGDHSIAVERTKYYQRLFYINRRMEHNVVEYVRHYTFYKTFKTSFIVSQSIT
jgi:hypothetical protein